MSSLRTLGWWLVIALVCGSAGGGVGAQEEIERDVLARELAGIRDSLDRLVALVETQVRQQSIELVIRRITLRERRIEPLERRMRDAEEELRARQQDLERIRAMIAEQEAEVDRAVTAGDGQAEADARRMLREIETVVRREEPLLDAATVRVRDLEDRIAEEREEIEILDEMLMERLEE